MTKEQFLKKWGDLSRPLKDDIDAVISTEIAKVQEQPQPALNPIAQAYEQGLKIRHKNWLNGDWIQKHKETKTIDNHGNINSVYPFAFIQHPEKWEIYTEPTEQTSSQVKLDNSFDRERFERMFRAVLVGDVYENAIKATEEILKQLDAYYASKEGGNNE